MDTWVAAMSNVHRLRTSDRIFFITTNLNRGERQFQDAEYPDHPGHLRQFKKTSWLSSLWLRVDAGPLARAHLDSASVNDFPCSSGHQETRVPQDQRLRKTKGSRWQHQFWDRFVRNSQEFAERLEYMHYNPVRKGLVEHPEQWRWSSANNFSLDKSVVAACPIQIDYVQLPDDYRA